MNKWAIRDDKKEFNYKLFLQITLVILIIFSLGLYRQNFIKKQIKD